MSLKINGACLGVYKSREAAEEIAAKAVRPGGYGNSDGKTRGFVIEEHPRRDGVVLFHIFRLVESAP